MRARSFGLTRLLAGLAVGILSSFAVAATGTADHAKFKELQGPFASGEDVTRACLSCHTEAARQVMATRHWTWEYANPADGTAVPQETDMDIDIHTTAGKLADRDRSLQAGDLVMTGTLTPILPIEAPATYIARFATLGAVAMHFA